MRKITIYTFSILTTLLLIVMSCVNVSAETEQDLGHLWTIVNDIPDSEAGYTYDPALTWEGGDTYSLELPAGDGRFTFYVTGEYTDNHLFGTNTGEHVFRMNGVHYEGGTTYHCNPSDAGGGAFYTDGGESGDIRRAIEYPGLGHIEPGDTIFITITAACRDVSEGLGDIAETGFIVEVTITS